MANRNVSPTPQIPADRGEGFFLNGATGFKHVYGRDDLAGVKRGQSEPFLHSAVDMEEAVYDSQYKPRDSTKAILSATRHLGSHRYQDCKARTGLACCVAALGELRNLRGRAWNEDIVDACLDVGYQYYKESLETRGGEQRRLILSELNEKVNMSGVEFNVKVTKGVAVWGRLGSSDPVVLDLVRGLKEFFKDQDAGILQIPGNYEVAIFLEGGKYYMFDPWPADSNGRKVGLREGGKAYVACFNSLESMCDHFTGNLPSSDKRKAFSISEVRASPKTNVPEPVANFKGVGPNRWIVPGRLHQGAMRFPEENRNKQSTPASIAAIAISHIHDSEEWTADQVDQAVVTGDTLYAKTLETNPNAAAVTPPTPASDENEEETEGVEEMATMPAGAVLNKFSVSDTDFIETEVLDSMYSGKLDSSGDVNAVGLKAALANMFSLYSHGVVTARGNSIAVWKKDNSYYYFDPMACDENGNRSDQPRSAACVMRVDGSVAELATLIEGNLSPGNNDNFKISPVTVSATVINQELGVPEIKLPGEAFDWTKRGTAALLLGARGETSAAGKVATRAGIKDDLAGRTLALPAAAAFTAAAVAVPPPFMHQDHMHNFIEAGADYYMEHVKKTGRTEMKVEDLANKFELGANTFSITVEEPITLPLRIPDPPVGGEGEEEEEKEVGEEVIPENPIKDIRDAMRIHMNTPNSVALLIGDYHMLGVWCDCGGQVVAFDPAPTLKGGLLTTSRINKGNELRQQRLAEEMAAMAGEGDADADDEEGEEEETGGEGAPPPEEGVPEDATPALHICASPHEFVTRLVETGGLTMQQRLSKYKLYRVNVDNQLTCNVKEKKVKTEAEDEENGGGEGSLSKSAYGRNYQRVTDEIASVRARVAQHEYYFMEENRDKQDIGNAIMGIVADNIESYQYWKPALCDAILKYGDRLYTMTLAELNNKQKIRPQDIIKEFMVLNFNVKLEVEPDVVCGDIKAGDSGEPLNVARGIKRFFETENKHGVLCSKEYCVGLWRGVDGNSYCMWDPHAVSASGKLSPSGSAGLIVFESADLLAETFLNNVDSLSRPGNNKFCISGVKVEFSLGRPPPVTTDTGYDNKVLTAYVEIASSKTILRGSRALDLNNFKKTTRMHSATSAIVGAAMATVRKPELWTRHTVDEIMKVSGELFNASIETLGYEFRVEEDSLLPLQVKRKFPLGVNLVTFDLQAVGTGKVESAEPGEPNARNSIDKSLGSFGTSVIWSAPHGLAAWRFRTSPLSYLFDPHPCGPTGARSTGDDLAVCVITFPNTKFLSAWYDNTIPRGERMKRDYAVYKITVHLQPLRVDLSPDAAAEKSPPAKRMFWPATSKVDMAGRRRCMKGSPPPVIVDYGTHEVCNEPETIGSWRTSENGVEFLVGQTSIHGKKFTPFSRGFQSVPVSVTAIVTCCIKNVCMWDGGTIVQILDDGEQLYKDSFLHYKPESKYLTLEQVVRKFYSCAGCVYRLTVFCARHGGNAADGQLVYEKLKEFFSQEKQGIFVLNNFTVALFHFNKGEYYMFEPEGRDGNFHAMNNQPDKMRACLSRHRTVKSLCDELMKTLPLSSPDDVDIETGSVKVPKFKIHGCQVSVAVAKNK